MTVVPSVSDKQERIAAIEEKIEEASQKKRKIEEEGVKYSNYPEKIDACCKELARLLREKNNLIRE
ncbi:MAG: hypothetical protein GF370_03390 [Candidatus Nealsonbacteria bacterium]|nr:hypothetical protein [Candidatus Nealsonbacteria bacterium]